MAVRKKIERLFEAEENKRKNISVNLDEEQIKKADIVANILSDINKSRTFSRNSIIEMALEDYLEECSNVLWDKKKIDLEREIISHDIITTSDKKQYENEYASLSTDFDLVTFPAHQINFEIYFLNQHRWFEVRISNDKVDRLKYIALYVGKPTSGITHYGEIGQIIDSGNNNNKKIIILSGPPIPIGRTIALGNTNSNAVRPPRYTTLKKLLNAHEIKDLF